MDRTQIVGKSKSSSITRSNNDNLPVETILEIWDNELEAFLEEHGREYHKTGNQLASKRISVEYDVRANHLIAQVGHETVSFMPDPSPVSIDMCLLFNCTCHRFLPYFDDYVCEHTFAAASYLKKQFDTAPMVPLVRKILGIEEPNWKVALGQLIQFANTVSGPVDSLPVPQSRLAWRIDVDSRYGRIQVEPIEQVAKPSKPGTWSKGRRLHWQNLTLLGMNLLPVDLQVIHAAQVSYYRDEPDDEHLGNVFQVLIGHPHVFIDAKQVNVRQGNVGLSLDEHQGSWVLQPQLDGRPLTSYARRQTIGRRTIVGYDKASSELIVANTDNQLLNLCNSLIQNPVTIPPDAQAQYIKLLPVLESKLPINLPTSLQGELVPADERMTLRIHPLTPTGATLDFRVTPAPMGQSFVPGEGSVDARGRKSESSDLLERVRVERDLDAELRRATALSEDLFLNRFKSCGPFAWTLQSDEDVLDLLDALRARPENDPIVAWPSDTEVRKMEVLGDVSPTSLQVEIKDQHDWFGLAGSLELGGKKFPLATLLAALHEGRRYISLGNGQFASITQAFRDRLAAVADMLHSSRGKLEFNSTAAPVIADLLEDKSAIKASKKWKETLARMNRATELNPQVPTTLTADLRDYQVEGFQWLCRLAEWGGGGILADDMGLGKTVQALAVLIHRRDVGPTLVVAPVSVGANWQREAERFAPTLNSIMYRDTDRVESLKQLGPGDMLITSYNLLQLHAEDLSTVKWGTLVLDEAQYIKNSQTKTAQVVRGLEADWRLALTGTPCENHLGDLWSVFRGVSPGLFGSWERFREKFADPIEKAKLEGRQQALSRVIRPFILRRTKSEVLKELPARTEIQLTVELSDDERKCYEDARLWAVTHLAGLEVTEDKGKDQRFQVLAALTKLRQLACHPRLVNEAWDKSSAKLDQFLETVEELREGHHRALVFSQFTSHLALIREALDEKKIAYQYLDGKTPAKKRQERVDGFRRGEGDLFLISLKAGGTGLNLVEADYVIHLDPWWNPAVEDQATDRAHRIGQTRPVTVYRLVAKETIEEQILKLHADKRNLVAGILDGTDKAAKLSTKELIDLIKLGGKQT